jgi:peptidyl-prolyl cis-trans isomerase D
VFRTVADKLPAYVGVDLGGEGYSIYQIERVVDPGPEQIAARRAQYQQQVLQLYAQQDAADLVASLKTRSKVVRHPERIAARTDSR